MKQKYRKFTAGYMLFLENKFRLNSTVRYVKNSRGIWKGYFKTFKWDWEHKAKKNKK